MTQRICCNLTIVYCQGSGGEGKVIWQGPGPGTPTNSNFLQNSGEIKMKISPAFFVLCVWELQQLDREEGGGGFLFRIIIFGGLFPCYNPRTVLRWDWDTVYSSSVLFHSRLNFFQSGLNAKFDCSDRHSSGALWVCREFYFFVLCSFFSLQPCK